MLRALIIGISTLAGTPTLAHTSPWTVEATLGVVSDYRYRGYSLSDDKPALQAGATLSHGSGVYADVYASTIDEYGIGDDGDGARIELTSAVGWKGDVAGYTVDVAVARYVYPRGDNVDYVEIPVEVSRNIDALSVSLGMAYAPDQSALGAADNRYGWASFHYAPTPWPVALSGRLGYEDGAFAPDGKTDWEIGVTRDVGAATLGLSWTDSDRTTGALVGSVFFGF